MGRGRRVEWDEDNLEQNAEYQRTHPVTLHCDEPKTPYVHIDDETAEAMDQGLEPTWDPKVNAYARNVKDRVAHERKGAPVAPVSRTGRPMLVEGTASGALAEERHEREFQQMRKAVYADEGAKFKALLAHQHDEEDEDDDDDEEKSGKREGESGQ